MADMCAVPRVEANKQHHEFSWWGKAGVFYKHTSQQTSFTS